MPAQPLQVGLLQAGCRVDADWMQAALNPLLQGECRVDAGFHFHSVTAIHCNNMKVARSLLENWEASALEVTTHDFGALHFAALNSNMAAVKLLLQNGAGPHLSLINVHGKTPLQTAPLHSQEGGRIPWSATAVFDPMEMNSI